MNYLHLLLFLFFFKSYSFGKFLNSQQQFNHMASENPFAYKSESLKYYGSHQLLSYQTDLTKAIDLIDLPENPRTFSNSFGIQATDEPSPDKQALNFLEIFITEIGMEINAINFYGDFLSCNIIDHRRLENSGRVPRVIRIYFASNECRDKILLKLTYFLTFMRKFCINKNFSTSNNTKIQQYCNEYNGKMLKSLLPEQYKSIDSMEEKVAKNEINQSNKIIRIIKSKNYGGKINEGNRKSVQKFVEKFQIRPSQSSNIPADYLRTQMILCNPKNLQTQTNYVLC